MQIEIFEKIIFVLSSLRLSSSSCGPNRLVSLDLLSFDKDLNPESTIDVISLFSKERN